MSERLDHFGHCLLDLAHLFVVLLERPDLSELQHLIFVGVFNHLLLISGQFVFKQSDFLLEFKLHNLHFVGVIIILRLSGVETNISAEY